MTNTTFCLLNEIQHKSLQETFISLGINLKEFEIHQNCSLIEFSYKLDPNYRFQVRKSINNASFDVYCSPYTYQSSIYIGVTYFHEIINLAKDWGSVFIQKINGIDYIHKIFVSHSSLDKSIVTEFVDKVLFSSCGLTAKNVIYTSLESTGVNAGEDIKEYIKQNIKEASTVILMISDNFKNSEICLNEMGAAWALDKEIIPILLPNTSFNQIGWLNFYNKAIKIDDDEALDSIYSKFNRSNITVSYWNRHKNMFIDFCKKSSTES